MRIPVFARGSNPAIDRPNQRKSIAYGYEEVNAGRADWIDPEDHRKGILCRAFFYQGETLKPAAPEQLKRLSHRSLPRSLPPLEVRNTEFDDPERRIFKRQERMCLVVRAHAFARFCDLGVSAGA